MKAKNFLNFSFLSFSSNEKIVQKIVDLVSGSAFHVYNNEDVRELIDFSNLDKVEQDRIFNELQVTALALVILLLEQKSNLVAPDEKDALIKLMADVENRFVNFLSEIGIAKEYVDLWSGLIKMRCDEYRKDFEEYEKEASESDVNPFLEITAVGGLFHIRRGKVPHDDALHRFIFVWLEAVEEEVEKMIEKIN